MLSLNSAPRRRTIDIHSHFVPQSAVGPAENGDLWHGIQFGRSAHGKITSSVGALSQELPWPTPIETAQFRLLTLNAMGIDLQIVSLSPTFYWYSTSSQDASAFARASNDDLAGMIETAPDRFAGLGYLPLQDVDRSIAELERCMLVHQFPGVMVGTNVNGLDWDDAGLLPVLQAAERLGAVVYFHPSRVRAAPFLKRFHFSNIIGNPLETTIALGSLIFGGVFDRLPALKTCFAHGGGYGVFGVGRMDYGHKVRSEASGIDHMPSEYLRSCWFDTITHSEIGLRQVMDIVGSDRVLMGSDYPADMGDPDPVGFVKGCASLTAAEKADVLGATAQRLFGL